MNDAEDENGSEGRRRFLRGVASAVGVSVVGCRRTNANETHGEEAEVTPGEDLMQEHGVLQRILLIYDEAAQRGARGAAVDGAMVRSAADIVRRFVEDYHERSEERHVFPRLEAARREVELVATLRRQHQRGRELTDAIVRLSATPTDPALTRALQDFSRMYRPHAAREDTVLFPTFRELVGRSAYHELGERFEHEEHARFGEHGFERTVADVARIEAAFGLDDLARFTP